MMGSNGILRKGGWGPGLGLGKLRAGGAVIAMGTHHLALPESSTFEVRACGCKGALQNKIA